MSVILELKNVSFSFARGQKLLDNLSLTLKEKNIYALMGANGAGKTTLFNILTGFIKPQNGEIIFRAESISQLAPYNINRKGISRTFQDLRLVYKLSVKENIVLTMQHNPSDNWLKAMMPEAFHRDGNKRLSEKADELIEKFFLTDVRGCLASEISYGQQKLLSIACCAANGSKLLLLDEAVAGLQPEYRNKIAMLLKQMKESGVTILLIEHNIDFIEDIADQIFFLREGKIIPFESMATLRKNKQVIDAYV